MNETFIQRGLKKVKSIKLNQNLLIFGFFLLISSIYWFFNALNREYYADLSVRLKYANFPENKLVAGNLSRQVNVKITAFGSKIMNYKTTAVKSAVIDLKQHSLLPIENNNKKFYILTSSIKDEITSILGPDIDIKSISPDSLIFDLDEVISKIVPVRKSFTLDFKKQYMLKEAVVLKPDSVILKGVKTLLDTINEVYTMYQEIEKLDDSFAFQVKLRQIAGTELTPKKVRCFIPVEKYTEMEFTKQIEVLNVPEGYRLRLFPSEARVAFNVGFSKYQYIFEEQFRITTDFSKLNEAQNTRLRLELTKKPDGISMERMHPQSVDYIIEKDD